MLHDFRTSEKKKHLRCAYCIQIYFAQVWLVESWRQTMFMRQVLASSPGVSRGVRSREPRREPPSGQSTWSRETVRALFPFAWLYVKWVFAYWGWPGPPWTGTQHTASARLYSETYIHWTYCTVGTLMIRHCLCLINKHNNSYSSYVTV